MGIKEWADLLTAIGHILWPLLTFGSLLLFRPQVRDLLGRLKKGKLLGQEIELQESLAHLQANAQAVAASLPPVPPEEAKQLEADRDEESKLLAEAGRSPKAALLLLAAQLERELRRVLAALGLWTERKPLTFQEGLRLLEKSPGYPKTLGAAVRSFYDVRTRLIHGHSTSDDEVISALDSGLTILNALNAIPRSDHVVAEANVPLYEDRECSKLRSNVKGLILDHFSPDGANAGRAIFPTTRSDFKKGTKVSWGWNMDLVTGESWYRDPTTSERKYAWTGSAEFVGRDLDTL